MNFRENFWKIKKPFSHSCLVRRVRPRGVRILWIEFQNFGTTLQVSSTSTENLWNSCQYRLNFFQFNTDKHAVHLMAQMFWDCIIPIFKHHAEIQSFCIALRRWKYSHLITSLTLHSWNFQFIWVIYRTVIWWMLWAWKEF